MTRAHSALSLRSLLVQIQLDTEWGQDMVWRHTHCEPYLSWGDFQKTCDVAQNRPFFVYCLLFVYTVVLWASYSFNGWWVGGANED